MIDMNAVKPVINKKVWTSKLYYKTKKCKYCMQVKSIDASNKLLHMELVIDFRETGTKRTYSMDKGGLSMPSKHMPIANELLELFESMIIIPHVLTAGKTFNIYNFYSELFGNKVQS